MEVRILELIEGAKKAEGLTVIIDVFRAFSLECYLFAAGAKKILPVGREEDAFALKREHPDWVLFGERGGAKIPGCDYGNSPSQCAGVDFTGKTIIHTTSAGTQGIVNAAGATEIVTGSLLNAPAVARYIRQQNPEIVSLVAMGNAGVRRANEDVLCAEYIKSLLLSEQAEETENAIRQEIQARADALATNGGEHFFREDTQEIFPREDFYMCTKCGHFDFVIGVNRDHGLENHILQ